MIRKAEEKDSICIKLAETDEELCGRGYVHWDLQIRKADIEDAEILIKIYNEAFYEDFVRYGECPAYGRSVDDMKKSIIEIPKFIGYHGSIPIGVISVKDKGKGFYYIGCLCVIPEFQRKGVGHQLIECMKAHYSDWKKIELITPVDKEKM